MKFWTVTSAHAQNLSLFVCPLMFEPALFGKKHNMVMGMGISKVVLVSISQPRLSQMSVFNLFLHYLANKIQF